MANRLIRILPWLAAAGAAVSPLEKITGTAYAQTINPPPVSAPQVPGQLNKTANPGLFNFNGTLVDVTDHVTRLPGKVLTFYSPEGVPYTVTSEFDGTFSKEFDTAVEDNNPGDEKIGYKSLSTSYEGNIRHIRFEAPEAARSAKVRIFNIRGQMVAEENYALNSAGMFDVPWSPESDKASGIYLGQVEITDNAGRTHYLGNIKIQNRAGNGGRGFLINGGSLSAGARPFNAVVTYDETTEEERRVAKASAGQQQWTLEISDPSGAYVTHRKYLLAEEGQNDLGLEDMLPADTTFIRQLDESFRYGGAIGRMNGKKAVYINTEQGRIADQTKTRILDYLTIDSGGAHNGTLDSLTLGNQRYSVNDVNYVNTANRPALGTEGTTIFDFLGGGNYFGIWTDGHGTITAAYINLTSGVPDEGVLQEIGSICTGIGDYDGAESLFNSKSKNKVPTPFDWKGFFYTFSRRPGTQGVGAQDDETAAGNLQKTAAPRFYPSKLTPENRITYDRVCANSVRPPDYSGFDF